MSRQLLQPKDISSTVVVEGCLVEKKFEVKPKENCRQTNKVRANPK